MGIQTLFANIFFFQAAGGESASALPMQAGWMGRVHGRTRLHFHPADTLILPEGWFFATDLCGRNSFDLFSAN